MVTKKQLAFVMVFGILLSLGLAYVGHHQLQLNPNNFGAIGAMVIKWLGLVNAAAVAICLVFGLTSETLFDKKSSSR